MMQQQRATHVDLVQRHAELGGKLLFDIGARLVLLLEVVLEDIVLVLGQTGFDVVVGQLLSAGRERRSRAGEAVGGVHGGCHGASRCERGGG